MAGLRLLLLSTCGAALGRSRGHAVLPNRVLMSTGIVAPPLPDAARCCDTAGRMDNPSTRHAPTAAEREARLAAPHLHREQATIAAMLRIYCRGHHPASARGAAGLCAECASLLAYARKRLALCTYGPEKPTCANCPIHCYGRSQREAIRGVMRYAGPRMLWRHPWLAIRHLIDGRRPAPPRPSVPPP